MVSIVEEIVSGKTSFRPEEKQSKCLVNEDIFTNNKFCFLNLYGTESQAS